MKKQRKNNNGFVFENKIDLTDWDFNRLEESQYEALCAFEEGIQKAIEKEREKLRQKLGMIEHKARKIASEALQIAIEKNVDAYFWEINDKPELLRIDFSDFSVDGYSIQVDLKKAVKDCLLSLCSKDGYIHDKDANIAIKFADMLKELETEVRTAIKLKED